MDSWLVQLALVLAVISLALRFSGLMKDPAGEGFRLLFHLIWAVVLPIITLVVWVQAGAEQRLVSTGFAPYPGHFEVQGMSAGRGVNRRTWIFKIEDDPEHALAFYQDSANTGDWDLVETTFRALIFERDEEQMDVNAGVQVYPRMLIYRYRRSE